MKLYTHIWVLLFIASAVACSGSPKRGIEIEPENGLIKPPGGDAGPGGDVLELATLTGVFHEDNFKDYLDFTKPIDYEFWFASTQKSGTVDVQDGIGYLDIANLPVGLPGKLKLTLLQDGKKVLEASAENVVLAKGSSEYSFDFKPWVDPDQPDPGGTDDAGTVDAGTDDGSTDDGSTDDGSTDDGSTDDGSTDDGSTDDGSTDDGSTDDAGNDDEAEIDIEVTIDAGDED